MHLSYPRQAVALAAALVPIGLALSVATAAAPLFAPPPPGVLEAVAARAPYRMAGATLMASPAQVATAFRAEGYEPDPHMLSMQKGQSFEDQVEARITGHAPSHPHEVPSSELWRKGQETIRVWYEAYPGGAHAKMFQWQTDDASPTTEEIVASLTKRYGPGWRRQPFLSPQWCSPMPCSDRSAILHPGVKEVWLSWPALLDQPIASQARLDAGVRARTGSKPGSF